MKRCGAFLGALFLWLIVSAGCSTLSRRIEPREVVERYLSAKTHGEAVSLLAPDYRLWFGERKGEGIDRETASRMLIWDYSLNVAHEVRSLTVDGSVVTALVHEENDFSRLIDFPGWNSTSTFVVDESGLIAEQVYVPNKGQPEWRPYLESALAWIGQHRPELLTTIFPEGKLARSKEAAREWVNVLREWRAATKRPAR